MRTLVVGSAQLHRTIETQLTSVASAIDAAEDTVKAVELQRTQFRPLVIAELAALGAGPADCCRVLADGAHLIVVGDGASPETVAELLRAGARDFLRLPEDNARLLIRVLEARAAATELTASQRAAEEQRRALAEHRAILERAADGVFTLWPNGVIAYANTAFATLLGFERAEQLVGRPAIELAHPDEHATVRARVAGLRETGKPTPPNNVRLVARDGSSRWIETRGMTVSYEGKPAVTVIARDITERRKSEEALRLSEERFSKIFQASPAGISITRLSDARFVDVNQRFVDMTGFGKEEVVGRAGVEVEMWRDPQSRNALFDELCAHQTVRDREVQLRRKSGAPLDVLMSTDTFELAGEVCIVALYYDVTERKHLEEQLRQSHKMEAIGRLAGGLSHDFNNLLTAIRGYSDLLIEQLPSASLTLAAAEHIRRSADRAASLTGQLLAFTRRQPLQPKVVQLNDVVRHMTGMLRRLIREDVEFVIALDPALGCVRVDTGQIEQIILNLAVNARDAMATGGRLTIETANADEGHVRLSVRDTGCGMSEETRRRIFEPFFTTKEVGKGTGLGLAIVYGVVEQSGGSITVESAPGEGSSFHVLLPSVAASIETAHAAPTAETGQRGQETILVVEDDEDVREFVELILRRAGYHVIVATGGVRALEMARTHSGEIHLLLSDIVMPDVDGLELAKRLVSARPTVKVLHMSGYTGDAVLPCGEFVEASAFLQKPFSARALAAKVREILDKR
jgi:PAS domain S-box-containing protein